MSAYYNEHEPFAAQWLRNLISAGLIATGDVDERSITDVQSDDLRGYCQCHFFAGIGVWPYALRCAGWPDDRQVWTGSCPCQPFSAAGSQRGTADERHLWPEFFRLIRECRPATLFGEQVASPAALAWLDLVQDDLEGEGYAVGAADICAAGVGAPHIRQRLYWMANTTDRERRNWESEARGQPQGEIGGHSFPSGLAHSNQRERGWLADGKGREPNGAAAGWHEGDGELEPSGDFGRLADSAPRRLGIDGCTSREPRHASQRDSTRGMADADGHNPGYREQQRGRRLVQPTQDPLAGFWRGAEWLLCTDGKARPVEPKYVALSNGNPRGMGYTGSNGCEAETEEVNAHPSEAGPDEVLRGMQEANAPSAIQRCAGIEPKLPKAEILRPEMHGGGPDARSGNESELHAHQGARDGEGCLRDLREGTEAARTPQGRESIQQRDRQFADFVRLLPSSLALAELSGDSATTEAVLALLQAGGAEELVQHPSYEVEAVWRSLAQEVQDRVRLGFEQGGFLRTFVHPLAHGITNRVGKLRAYGNALCAPVAEAFVRAAMESDGQSNGK